jgi:hypothetical protein
MNIFALSDCPKQAAKWYCDRHCTKMPLEIAQLLCSVFWMQKQTAPYKLSHKNHPCSIFVRESCLNFEWTVEHGLALCKEYTERYNRVHASQSVIQWCSDNCDQINFDVFERTDFKTAISDDCICKTLPEFENANSIEKYRMYYIHDKKHLHQWKQNKPYWIN